MLRETTLKPAAHLTCVSANKEEIDEVIRDYWDLGVRSIENTTQCRISDFTSRDRRGIREF
jgi:hypothetical protein